MILLIKWLVELLELKNKKMIDWVEEYFKPKSLITKELIEVQEVEEVEVDHLNIWEDQQFIVIADWLITLSFDRNDF